MLLEIPLRDFSNGKHEGSSLTLDPGNAKQAWTNGLAVLLPEMMNIYVNYTEKPANLEPEDTD